MAFYPWDKAILWERRRLWFYGDGICWFRYKKKPIITFKTVSPIGFHLYIPSALWHLKSKKKKNLGICGDDSEWMFFAHQKIKLPLSFFYSMWTWLWRTKVLQELGAYQDHQCCRNHPCWDRNTESGKLTAIPHFAKLHEAEVPSFFGSWSVWMTAHTRARKVFSLFLGACTFVYVIYCGTQWEMITEIMSYWLAHNLVQSNTHWREREKKILSK